MEEEPQALVGVKLVVDADLVFSCIIRSDGGIGELMLRSSELFEPYAPELISHGLETHHDKLVSFSKLNDESVGIAKELIMARIDRVDEALISKGSSQDAEKLLGPIDAFDVP